MKEAMMQVQTRTIRADDDGGTTTKPKPGTQPGPTETPTTVPTPKPGRRQKSKPAPEPETPCVPRRRSNNQAFDDRTFQSKFAKPCPSKVSKRSSSKSSPAQ